MKTALLIGGIGIVLGIFAPALRSLRFGRPQFHRMTDQEYFAAARRRAIEHRLAARARRTAHTGQAK